MNKKRLFQFAVPLACAYVLVPFGVLMMAGKPSDPKSSTGTPTAIGSGFMVKRAKHMIEYEIPIDVEKLGEILNKAQIDSFLEVMQERRIYLQVLTTRMLDLEAFPLKPGVFVRFVGVAQLNVAGMNEKLGIFAKSLGLESEKL